MAERPKKKWGPFKVGCLALVSILGIVALWFVYALHWAYSVEPGGGNAAAIRLEELLKSHQPQGHDGAKGFHSLQDAIAIYVQEDAAFMQTVPRDPPDADWPSNVTYPYDFDTFHMEGVPRLVKTNTLELMDRMQKAGLPEALRKVSTERSFVRPIVSQIDDNLLLDLQMHEIGRMRGLCRINSARMNLAAQSGDNEELVAAFDSSLSLARVCASWPFYIARNVGFAIFSLAARDLRLDLVERRHSAETIGALMASLESQAVWPSFDLCANSEREFFRDAVQKSYSDEGNGDGRLILTKVIAIADPPEGGGFTGINQKINNVARRKASNLLGFIAPGKKEILARGDQFYDAYLKYAALPAVERPATLPRELELSPSEKRSFLLLGILMPSAEKHAWRQSAHETNVAGTRLMLAIELYRIRNNAVPDSLDQLAPDCLSEVPGDPLTGTSFGYLKLPEPDEFGRHYILYSFGSNGVDDGGEFDPEYNSAAQNPTSQPQPLDWILNPPRQPYQPPE